MLNAEEILLKEKKEDIGPIRPKSEIIFPVTAFIEELDLTVYFDYPIGSVSIIINDSNDVTVYTGLSDSGSTSFHEVNLDFLDSGTYTIELQYGVTVLEGTFEI